MKVFSIAFGLGLSLLLALSSAALAQKIVVINGTSGATSGIARASVRVVKFGRIARGPLAAFALPDQKLYPPYYRFSQPYAQGPHMRSYIRGGKTVRQGSPWRSHVQGGKTIEGGAATRSHIRGGRTVEGGSRRASHIVPGRTVEGGSPWASTMPNWRFSGYAAPLRPRGITYYRVRAARSPWASRLR